LHHRANFNCRHIRKSDFKTRFQEIENWKFTPTTEDEIEFTVVPQSSDSSFLSQSDPTPLSALPCLMVLKFL
jgi:hypothetical protein